MEIGGHRLVVFLLIAVSLHGADVSDPTIYENCTDYRNQVVAHGERFRPMNADACHTCSCEYGRPEMCQSRLCSAPKGCYNPVPVDDTCCEFECLDDRGGGGEPGGKPPPANGTILEPTDDILTTTNLGLRLVASTVTSFLILALLLFMIHRLRQRRLLLMLRRLDMNGSHLSSAPFGVRRYSFDDDGSVGYLTGQDQVDFAPYDEPPPPYTFWKPPESYFPQEEAPPPYEASNNNNSINNAVNSSIHQNGGNLPLAHVAPLIPNPSFPSCCITQSAYVPQASVYANATFANNAGFPSVTQVPLRTNNFHMNNLDEVREPSAQRHSVPIHDLNVVGSLSSLNSSQSELNDSHAEPTSSSTLVIRSDAVYEAFSAGLLPPLSPAGSGGVSAGALAAPHGEASAAPPPAAGISTGTYSVKRSKYGKKPAGATAAAVQSSPLKCHSCSDVVACRHPTNPPQDATKRRSLQAGAAIRFCPDPTSWSESSSSSSPTYERTTGTLSPTSSDSSSVDYTLGDRLPRRTHSDTQFASQRKASAPSLVGSSTGAIGGGSTTAAMSSSLDRTLFNLRSKISLNKKKQQQKTTAEQTQQLPQKGQPGKLRKLLGGLHASPDDERRETQDLCPVSTSVATSQKPPTVAIDSAVDGSTAPEAALRNGPSAQRPGWRTPRILYVSDGDISLRSLLNPATGGEEDKVTAAKPRPRNLDLEKRCRPHSYDFGDLQDAAGESTYPIVEEEGTPASAEDATRSDNPSSLPTNTVDCCCSLSSDRLGGSWDSFTCTCSSRASLASGSSEVPGSPESPTRCPVANSPPFSTPFGLPRTWAIAAPQLNRSGSVCSETGEKRHRTDLAAEVQMLSPVCEAAAQQRDGCPEVAAAATTATPAQDPSTAAAGPPPPTLALANRIRVTIGTWKGSHESYI